ncbi:hypothetical protein [Spiroplasma endosymbiont of Notiophilus biguttatus]|uniref:hypothetical protein n=1 Tax=Spiroplasma endosymbiont of Notiophilus biguttatus TaxID=3066285 RepID=UPI00313D270B
MYKNKYAKKSSKKGIFMDEKNKREKEIAKIKEKFAANKIRKEAEKAEKERQQQEIENKKKNENKKTL